MIILDTNVLSEPMRPHADPAVIAWLDAQPPETLFITTITVAEILLGIELMPLGARRSHLEARVAAALQRFGDARTLPFTLPAARYYSLLAVRARASGHPIGVPDAQIASIAAAHGFTVATRDTSPFIAAGLPVINPWLTTHP